VPAPTIFDQLPLEEQLQVDELCGTWERIVSNRPFGSIGDVLRMIDSRNVRRALRLELLLTQLDQLASNPSCQPGVQAGTGGPSSWIALLEGVLQSDPELAALPPDFAVLVARAFYWSQQGEAGGAIHDYLRAFGRVDGVEQAVRTMLAETWPAAVRVTQPETALEISLAKPLVIGRQRHGDPQPVALVSDDKTEQRLVVAPRDELRISRRQLRLERITRHELELSNISQRSQVLIDFCHVLMPGEVIVRPFPIQFQIMHLVAVVDEA
jgi:hypothetical protein